MQASLLALWQESERARAVIKRHSVSHKADHARTWAQAHTRTPSRALEQESEGVIVIAATNFPEVLDKALVRPGRFDRHVVSMCAPSTSLQRALGHMCKP